MPRGKKSAALEFWDMFDEVDAKGRRKFSQDIVDKFLAVFFLTLVGQGVLKMEELPEERQLMCGALLKLIGFKPGKWDASRLAKELNKFVLASPKIGELFDRTEKLFQEEMRRVERIGVKKEAKTKLMGEGKSKAAAGLAGAFANRSPPEKKPVGSAKQKTVQKLKRK